MVNAIEQFVERWGLMGGWRLRLLDACGSLHLKLGLPSNVKYYPAIVIR